MAVLSVSALLLSGALARAGEPGSLPDLPVEDRFPTLEEAPPIEVPARPEAHQRFLRRQRIARWAVYGGGASALLYTWGIGAIEADRALLGSGTLERVGAGLATGAGVGLLVAAPVITFTGLWANLALLDTGAWAGSWTGRLATGMLLVGSPILGGSWTLWGLAVVPASIQVMVNQHGWRRFEAREVRVALIPKTDGLVLVGSF